MEFLLQGLSVYKYIENNIIRLKVWTKKNLKKRIKAINKTDYTAQNTLKTEFIKKYHFL